MRPVLFVFCTAAIAPAAVNQAQLARIGPRMKAFVDQGKAAGIVTLIQHQGKTVHHEAAGYLKLEDKTPMAKDSIFEVMSMTKPVTGTAIMMLAEDGRLALTDPVEKHLPEFRGQMVQAGERQVKPARPITIRDLMTHTSGLPEMPPPGMGGVQHYFLLDKTLAQSVTMYSQMPLLFQPGTAWQYSNPGIATLGRIIEVLTDQPYEQYLAERIFKPLAMKDSFLLPPENAHARIAHAYRDDGGKLNNMGPVIYRKGAKYSFPEGGLYATAVDMAAFYSAYLRGGRPLISKAAYETMTAIHTADVQRGGNAFGLSWSVVQNASGALSLRSVGSYGHGGALGTLGWIDPKRDLVGVLMVQLVGGAVSELQTAFVELAEASVE